MHMIIPSNGIYQLDILLGYGISYRTVSRTIHAGKPVSGTERGMERAQATKVLSLHSCWARWSIVHRRERKGVGAIS